MRGPELCLTGSLCGTIAFKAKIFCLVGRSGKTKFDLALPGVGLELPATLAQSQLPVTMQPLPVADAQGDGTAYKNYVVGLPPRGNGSMLLGPASFLLFLSPH